MARNVKYDRKIIQKFADRLYSQANSIIAVCALIGLVGGALVGFSATPLIGNGTTASGIGAVLGLVVGIVIGIERAFSLKLRAQQALCQADTELNTRATRDFVEQLARAGSEEPGAEE